MSDRAALAAALSAYEIGDELGRGAMGVVFAARHHALDREVAVKVLPTALAADPAVRRRFVVEARTLASLSHPHIVPIYDFIDTDDLCVLVMERLGGGTLSAAQRVAPIDAPTACALTLSICSGLHYAHQHGILHRDVKPDNVLFSVDGTLKVTDFGIAKVLGNTATLMTRTGFVLGTPAYMAPEQALGQPVAPTTDVYATAVVLYWLLAGRLPFSSEGAPLLVLFRRIHERPVDIQALDPEVPRELARPVMRALERDPGERFESAEGFAAALKSAAGELWGSDWLERTRTTLDPADRVAVVTRGDRRPAAANAEPSSEADWAAVDLSNVMPVVARAASPASAGSPALAGGAASGTPPPSGSPPPSDTPPSSDTPPPAGPAAPAARSSPEPAGTARTSARGSSWRYAVGLALLVAVAGVVALTWSDGDDPGREPAPATPGRARSPAASSPWQALRPAPTTRQQFGAAVLFGSIWAVGGLTAADARSTPTVEVFDPVINTWRPGPELPLTLHHAMAVAHRDRLVVLGGWQPDGADLTARTLGRVLSLDGERWTDLPPLRHPRAAGAAVAVGNRIVVVGGQADGRLVRQTEIFDGKRWHDRAPIPTPREHLAAATDGRYVYVVGGRALSSDRNTAAFERYDPAADAWKRLPPMPTPRGGLGAAIVRGLVVVVGGETPTSVLDRVEAYSIADRSWATLPALGTPRHGHATVAINRTVYSLGGAERTGHASSIATTEAYSP